MLCSLLDYVNLVIIIAIIIITSLLQSPGQLPEARSRKHVKGGLVNGKRIAANNDLLRVMQHMYKMHFVVDNEPPSEFVIC